MRTSLLRSLAPGLMLALLASGAGCSGKKVTEIVVGIASDLSPGAELSAVSLEVHYPPVGVSPTRVDERYRQIQLYWDVDPAAPDSVHLPASVGLLPGRDPLQPVLVTVRGLLGVKERVRRQAQLLFAPDRVVLLQLNLLRRCRLPVDCTEAETCGEDGCEPIVKDSRTLPEYDEARVTRPFYDAKVTVDGARDVARGEQRAKDAAVEVPRDASASEVRKPDAPGADGPKPDQLGKLDAAKTPDASTKPDLAAADQGGGGLQIAWTKATGSLGTANLNAVWGTTRMTAGPLLGFWAVGDGCAVYHCELDGAYCGKATVPAGCTDNLHGVWGAGSGATATVVAVGASGRALQWTGSAGQFTDLPIANLAQQTLRDVWGTAQGSGLWVIAGEHTMIDSAGGWHAQPTLYKYAGVWGPDGFLSNVVALGQAGYRAQHPMGTWDESLLTVPGLGSIAELRGVWGTGSGSTVFAAANLGTPVAHLLMRSAGIWTSVATLPNAMSIHDLSGTQRGNGQDRLVGLLANRRYLVASVTSPGNLSGGFFPSPPAPPGPDLVGIHVMENDLAVAVGVAGSVYLGKVP